MALLCCLDTSSRGGLEHHKQMTGSLWESKGRLQIRVSIESTWFCYFRRWTCFHELITPCIFMYMEYWEKESLCIPRTLKKTRGNREETIHKFWRHTFSLCLEVHVQNYHIAIVLIWIKLWYHSCVDNLAKGGKLGY